MSSGYTTVSHAALPSEKSHRGGRQALAVVALVLVASSALVLTVLPSTNKSANAAWYYLHIPKCGGTSFGNALISAHSRMRSSRGVGLKVCRGWNLPHFGYQKGSAVDEACLPAVARWLHGARRTSWCRVFNRLKGCRGLEAKDCHIFVSSHFGANVLEEARRAQPAGKPPLATFTMLRHPVEQFYSYWSFIRYCASYDVEGQMSPPANRSYDSRWSASPLDLRQAIRHEIEHCRHLSSRCHSARFRALALLSGTSSTCGDVPSQPLNTSHALARALRQARSLDFVGFVEAVPQSMTLLGRLVGRAPTMERQNGCSGYRPLPGDVRTADTDRLLHTLLADDIRLYSTLRADFEQKLATN